MNCESGIEISISSKFFKKHFYGDFQIQIKQIPDYINRKETDISKLF